MRKEKTNKKNPSARHKARQTDYSIFCCVSYLFCRIDPVNKAHQSDGKDSKDKGEDLTGHSPQLDASESLLLAHLGLIDVMMMVMMFVMIMLMLR